MTESSEKKFPAFYNMETGDCFVLAGRVVTIGSSGECAVVVKGRGIAGHVAHCMFSGGCYQLQSLGTSTPVRVNSRRLSGPHALAHGDIVSIGGEQFEYRDGREKTDSVREKNAGNGPLEEIIGIAVSLLRNRDEDVSASLVESVSRLLRCDAARLVVENPGDNTRETLVTCPAGVGIERFSSRAIDWARESSMTVLMNNTDWAGSAHAGNSLEQNAVGSILCAALRHGEILLGYLYLDRLKSGRPFTGENRSLCDTLVPLFSEILANAQERRRQRETIARLQNSRDSSRGNMIFESEIMAGVIDLARKLARTGSPVLVLGETGTGKELIARYLHDQSSRAVGVFRAINCGAIPENLIESELFGHEKGAFTGAVKQKIGLLESANGGTVFLDEIGELPFALQVKLLRVLQESEIVRLGSVETISIDVRIIAATNRDLEGQVRDKTFRQDLFYRLNVLTLTLPPLRDRERDVLLLAEYFIGKYCGQFGVARKLLSRDAQSSLLVNPWPGNVRELENVIQKAVLLSAGEKIEAADIFHKTSSAANGEQDPAQSQSIKGARLAAEKSAMESALRKTGGNVSRAARILDIDRKWLMKKMNELDVDANRYRDGN